MPFQPHRIRWSWALRLIPLAGMGSPGTACAEPPARDTTPAPQVAPVDDEPGQHATDELGEYIRQLDRHLEWMHSRAEYRQDADTLKAVEAIQKKLAIAKANHRELCRLCEEQLPNAPDAMACCQKIDDVMHEVIDDHLALMRRLHTRRQRRLKEARS